ncbi:MAG: zinc permease [Actinomycetota bacterium]|jgi:zinc transporter, ZIP family|nr:zinc permease [Actinomycetota bacterium]
MSTAQTLILGAVAGLTIFVGLPMGRVRSTSPALRASLSAIATGILVFLFWDVVSHGVAPVQTHLEARDWAAFLGYAGLLGLGFTLGMMSLVYYDGWLQRRRATPLVGPGAAAVDEFRHRSWFESLTPGRRLALLIATGIGLHNFGEGLAIGQSAAAGELSLALVLIIGFGLHNATEGFGIVGPMSGEPDMPSWGFLGLMGLIGGGPTFLGTLIGQVWVSPALEAVFFAVAGGSILYVVIQLFDVCKRYGMPKLVAWMLLVGLLLGFGTDWVLVAAGA